MEISMDLLKQMAITVYEKVNPLIGTAEASREFTRGAGGDISMHIDIVAENAIIDILEKNKINILLISEEVGEKYIGNKEKAINNQQKLIVDPIDGSTNSVRNIPFCCVSIAYAIGNKLQDIKKAVIINLITKDIFWAEKSKGAFFNEEKINVSERGIEDKLIFELDFNLINMLDQFTKYFPIIQKLYRIRVMGSIALSFCLLARGSIDGFIDFRDGTRLVDIAASYLIVLEAGGNLFSKDGVDLDYLDIQLKLGSKIALVASNARLEPFIKKELTKILSK